MQLHTSDPSAQHRSRKPPVGRTTGSPEFRVAISTLAPEYALAGATSCLLAIVGAVLLIYAVEFGTMMIVGLVCFVAAMAMLLAARYRLRAALRHEAERDGLPAADEYARTAEARWADRERRRYSRQLSPGNSFDTLSRADEATIGLARATMHNASNTPSLGAAANPSATTSSRAMSG